MSKVIKKCLACGTLNQYEAKVCKSCECVLLADVDQEDEILSIDPMEAALDDAVSSADQEDEMVAQILREQAENAKKIVAKEIEKEERKKKQESGSGFGLPEGEGKGSFSFSIGGQGKPQKEKWQETGKDTDSRSSTTGSFGFKISGTEYTVKDEEAPGQVHLGGGSLRMQAIRQSQSKGNPETKK